MRSVLIVSPEPESARVLSLAFELDGWTAREISSFDHPEQLKGANVVIFDAIEGGSELRNADQWNMIVRECGKNCALIIILPRGAMEADTRRRIGDGPILVRRPFELLQLVKSAGEHAIQMRSLRKSGARRKTEAPRK